MKLSKEVKVGTVMLLSIGLLVWGANFLKGNDLFKKDRKFFAVYDHVDGLSVSNPVLINGFKVGQVEDINFISNRSGKLLVKLSVHENEFFIPQNTQAKIVSSDLLGSKSINLILGDSQDEVKNLDTLNSDIEASLTEAVNQQIAPLKKRAEALISTVDSAIMVVSSIFNKQARSDLNQSFTSIKSSLQIFENTMKQFDGMVADEREHVNKIFANVESITKNFSENNENLSLVIKNLEAVTDSLAGSNLRQTVNNASVAMTEVASMMEKINRGEGTMGALVNNDTLYNNLEAAASDLDSLLYDMRENPKRYVHFSIFGRKDKSKKKKGN